MAFNSYKKDEFVGSGEFVSSGSSMSYLGKTMKIKGKITSDEYLTVEGQVEGNINISKTLTIGKEGYVNGQINAEEVKIDGKVEGKITAANKLEITSSGTFQGAIQADKLVIEEGAVFQGKINLDEDE
ncbi:MAG: polymer-forming cytoskeletal protein [Candidatus Aminicenantes bacterium]|nr:MAG: polymer-forming cytoskeletal protein [Candidatus Aminicenantes bacterium]